MTTTVPAPVEPATPLPRDREDPVLARRCTELALVAAGFGPMLTKELSSVPVLLLALLPVVLPALRRIRSVGWVWLALVGASVVSGWALRSGADVGLGASSELAVAQAARLLTGAASVLILLWARTVLPLWRVGVWYGAGLLLAGLATTGALGPEGYKFYLSGPVAVIGLALADRWDRKVVTAVVALVLGVVGVVADARSYMGYCVLTAVLLLWLAARSSESRMNRWSPLILIATFAGGLYWFAQFALTRGLLGSQVQSRSLEQVDASGSLIVGGRPEWAATIQLMKVHPTGFGLDVLPSWNEITQAKQGLQAVGLNVVDNGYVDKFMFGESLNLHSTVADLWAGFGLVGLALALLCVGLIVTQLSRSLADRSAVGLTVYAGFTALWFLAFGPAYTNWPDVCLAVGLLIPLRDATVLSSEAEPAPAVAVPAAPTTSSAAPDTPTP